MAKKYVALGNTLKKLLFERNMKPVDLARQINLPPPTIHRLITGKSTRPYQSSLKPIANFFSITVDQLLGEEPLTKIEIGDTDTIEKNDLKTIPVLSWGIPNGSTNVESFNKRIVVSNDISDKSFALIMADTSMEPLFQQGSILIFDPCVQYQDRSYILVELFDSRLYVFRQLLIDADHKYLKPLNPDLSTFKMRLLNNNDKIVACLVEARYNFQTQNSPNPLGKI